MKKQQGISVAKPVKIKLESLHFAKYNPRTIKREKIANLKASILEHGLILSLAVQRKSDDGTPFVVIGGHARKRAVEEICEEKGWKVPEFAYATVHDVPDWRAKLMNAALNHVEAGETDPHKLGEMFSDPKIQEALKDETNVLATGFTRDQIKAFTDLTRPVVDELPQGPKPFAKAPTLSIEFDTAKNRDKAKEIIAELVESNRVKAGAVVLRALKAAAPIQKRR